MSQVGSVRVDRCVSARENSVLQRHEVLKLISLINAGLFFTEYLSKRLELA